MPLLLALLVVAAYLSQIGLGRWQSDEYLFFRDQRILGWHAVQARLFVSPRPLSELFIFIYGQSVLALNRPLVIECLAVLWAGLIGCTLLAGGLAQPAMRARWLTAASLALSFLAFVLVTNPVTEVFYWPIASVAYMPTIAGALAHLIHRRSGIRWRM